MAIRSSFASLTSLTLIRTALLFVCLALLIPNATTRSTPRHLKPDGCIRPSPDPTHAQGWLHTWGKIIKSKIWADSYHSESILHRLEDGNGQPTQRLRTRYSNDLVLRFKYSTVEELSALTEACDVLFLDVWEIGDSFVDIRLAKETVSLQVCQKCRRLLTRFSWPLFWACCPHHCNMPILQSCRNWTSLKQSTTRIPRPFPPLRDLTVIRS